MATFNGQNYQKQYVDKPSEKIEKGESAGRKRIQFDKYVLSSALAVNDEILVGFLPANSLVTDAKIKIDKSLGATGIFELGHKASASDSEDSDAFVSGADAGGQAVLARASLANPGIHKRFNDEVALFVTCTEVMDGSVLDGVISIEVEYVND
jgi:hypothetical protein